MDYFAEIAENPDIEDALDRVPGLPVEVSDGRATLAATYPGVWRSVLINAFHAHPDVAAKVWRALGSGKSARQGLARVAVARYFSYRWSKPSLKGLDLKGPVDEAALERWIVTGATDVEVRQARQDLSEPYPGPVFLEKLIALEPSLTAQAATAGGRMDAIEALIAAPDRVRTLAKQHAVPVPFSMMQAEELDQIAAARQAGGRVAAATAMPARGGAPLRRALDMNLMGLSFSGGGIRSATFNLGVLQALAKLDVLRHCDYLSTVSGGGYIGTWFSAWMHREAHDPAAQPPRTAAQTHDVMRQRLSPTHSPSPLDSRIRPIRYLREFSNYLTPQLGFFSADTWTMVAIYIRNVLLNWLVLIPLIAAVLLLPRLVFGPAQAVVPREWSELVILLLVLTPLCVLLPNLRRASPPADWFQLGSGAQRRRDDGMGRVPLYARQGTIQLGVVLPFLLAACLTAIRYKYRLDAVAPTGHDEEIWRVSTTAGVVFFVYLGVIHWAGRFYRSYRSMKGALLALGLATVGASAAAFGLFWLLGHIVVRFDTGPAGLWQALTFGAPLTLAVYSFIVVVQLGLLGAQFPDEQREWWSRLRAWTLIYSLGWAALFIGAVWIPYWLGLLKSTYHLDTTAGWTALIAWALSTFAGIKAGGSTTAKEAGSASGGNAPAIKTPPSLKARAVKIVALVAPYIFIVGLVALVSFGLERVLQRLFEVPSNYWEASAAYPVLCAWPSLTFVTVVLLAVSLFISSRIGVNEFSMHHFYRNRLVRCYLGASRWQSRKADWFTGFDAEDDIHLAGFDHRAPGAGANGLVPYSGPYPIVNAALNLVAGEDLAWQERKATSFVFTPKYCGYDVDRAVMQKDKGEHWPDAFAPTLDYVAEGVGPTLGTAMAISGAAASPNMGALSSPASAFLMTVFNARLGWWMPNPRRKGWFGWDRSGPGMGINYTAIELFGLTDDEKKFVNLSDGGHFENLGVYELIRRGCRYVIVCDAGQDGAFNLEDLGNLIRKCRTDFGVEIEIVTDPIRSRNAMGWSSTHCVVGKIHYHGVPRHGANGLTRDASGQIPHEEGLLLYLKPSITGDEPYDILEYYRRVPEFPHESTADQWFNESQFESYRRLGLHIAETAFRRNREKPEQPVASTKALFEYLNDFWHPPSPTVGEHSTGHAEEYSRLMELLRSKEEFRALDHSLFPAAPLAGLGGQRDEFYVCNAMIQLMENVYADLDLEKYYDHPHVRGWMNVFRTWAKQPAFRRTWDISKTTYASRFQLFFEDRLLNAP